MPTTQSTMLPDHVLGAMFALAQRTLRQEDPNKTRLAFRSHNYQLQEVFHELHETGKYPILDVFVFSDNGPEPYSPALNESVSRLQLSGLIGRENPDYEFVFLRPAADRFFEEVLKKEFGGEQIDQLNEVAAQFLARVSKI